jgi:hypothetical protein
MMGPESMFYFMPEVVVRPLDGGSLGCRSWTTMHVHGWACLARH